MKSDWIDSTTVERIAEIGVKKKEPLIHRFERARKRDLVLTKARALLKLLRLTLHHKSYRKKDISLKSIMPTSSQKKKCKFIFVGQTSAPTPRS